jgi:hypothetical protein
LIGSALALAVFGSVLYAAPAFLLIVAGTHLLHIFFRTVPLAVYGLVVLAPFAMSGILQVSTNVAVFMLAALALGLFCGLLLAAFYRSRLFTRLNDEERLALEAFGQAGLIGLLTALFGPQNNLLPGLSGIGTQVLLPVAQGMLAGLLGGALVILPLLHLVRHDRLLIISEAPEIALRLRLTSRATSVLIGAVSGVCLTFGSLGLAFDRGFNTYGASGTLLFALAVGMVIPPGRLALLAVVSLALLVLRAWISYYLGGEYDEAVAAGSLACACVIGLKRQRLLID